MPLSPDLFQSIEPPHVWITLGPLADPQDDTFPLTVRIKDGARRSVSATVPVTRYAPTDTAVRAAAECIKALTIAQAPLSRGLLAEQLAAAVKNYVDPF